MNESRWYYRIDIHVQYHFGSAYWKVSDPSLPERCVVIEDGGNIDREVIQLRTDDP